MNSSRFPPTLRYSFPELTERSPTFVPGDLFWFDAERWRIDAPNEYLISRDADGRLTVAIDDHGEKHYGKMAGVLSFEAVPTGFPRGEDITFHSS